MDPQLLAKYRRRLPGFDEKVVSLWGLLAPSPADDRLYARGMTVREITVHTSPHRRDTGIALDTSMVSRPSIPL